MASEKHRIKRNLNMAALHRKNQPKLGKSQFNFMNTYIYSRFIEFGI